MSENLFRIQSLAQSLCTWMVLAFLVFAIASVVYLVVSEYFDTKKRKAEKDLREIRDGSQSKIRDLELEKISATQERKEEIIKEIVEIEDNEKEASKDLEAVVTKYEKKYNNVDNLKYVQYAAGGVVVFILFIVLLLGPLTGGSFSSLRRVDYGEMDLNVTGYYLVTYNKVDQVTLTVFVKNNSDKSLRSAQITQKGTNNTAFVRNLDSGEEKIVTIDTYPSESYEFVFDNIEYIE